MKAARLVLYLCLGFLLRSLALFLWGGGGLSDYRQAEAGRAALEKNIEDLKRINSELRREVDSLGSDPERVTWRRAGWATTGRANGWCVSRGRRRRRATTTWGP